MRRRHFIMLLGRAAVAWPLAARAQQSAQMRRIGVLMPFAKDNPDGQALIAAFLQGLQKLGWTEGRNLQIEYRWSTGDLQKAAAELVALSPDVILANSTPAVAALQQATRSVPIVFANVGDPVSGGLVDSLAKPGGNITGFSNYDYGMGAKWVELLKEIAPYVTHVGVIRDPTVTANMALLGVIQSAARTFGLEVSPLGGRDARDIERTVTEFAGGSNRGLIAVGTLSTNNYDLIICWRRDIDCRRSIHSVSSSVTVASSLTDLTRLIGTGKLLATWIASLRAKSPPTFQCRVRPNSSW
jgi:putative ABC transport system substrate-binding protein